MAFAITADPARFDEACDWFLKRTVITADEAARLGTEAGRRAFWIGGGLQLTQVQRVFDSIAKAQEKGEPFEEWRERVRKELRNDAHAETVFRNATQRSLSAGRWRQMHDPAVVKHRPYGMFDAVRPTTHPAEVCTRSNKTILPLSHPWWSTHCPPLHHRCQSGIRSLTEREATRRGITNVPPALGADEGFGLAPDADPVWKPDPAKHDPALLGELERKQSKPRREPKPKGAPKEHDPKHWEKHYAKTYGEAAPNVAWGRAMLERGLDRSPADILAELEAIRADRVPGEWSFLTLQLRKLDQNRPLRAQVALPVHRFAAALTEHARAIKRAGAGAFQLSGHTSPHVTAAARFFEQLSDRSVKLPAVNVEFRAGMRAYATGKGRIIVGRTDEFGVIHELAHEIEFADPRALARSLAFLRARTAGENASLLSRITGRPYGPDELARQDEFIEAYIGKDYGTIATEITSIGYEVLAGGSSGDADLGTLINRDQDMLFFLLGQLAGR